MYFNDASHLKLFSILNLVQTNNSWDNSFIKETTRERNYMKLFKTVIVLWQIDKKDVFVNEKVKYIF